MAAVHHPGGCYTLVVAEAFGFPLIICHVNGQKEMFFGSDRFELMAHCIGEQWMGPQPNKMSSKM